jgi:hypothetical protein
MRFDRSKVLPSMDSAAIGRLVCCFEEVDRYN